MAGYVLPAVLKQRFANCARPGRHNRPPHSLVLGGAGAGLGAYVAASRVERSIGMLFRLSSKQPIDAGEVPQMAIHPLHAASDNPAIVDSCPTLPVLAVSDSYSRIFAHGALPTCVISDAPGSTFQQIAHERANMANLIDTLKTAEFAGWLGLAFGNRYLEHCLLRNAVADGIVASTRRLAAEYLALYSDVAARWPQCVVWGLHGAVPAAVTSQLAPSGGDESCGHEVDRNFAVILFNRLLESGLKERGIPFVTLHTLVIGADGTSNATYFQRDCSLNTHLAPIAMQLLGAAIACSLPASETPADYDVHQLAMETHGESGIDRWLRFSLANDVYVDSVAICAESAGRIKSVEITHSRNSRPNRQATTFENIDFPEQSEIQFPFREWARDVYVRLRGSTFVPQHIRLLGRKSYFSSIVTDQHNQYGAMRDVVDRLCR